MARHLIRAALLLAAAYSATTQAMPPPGEGLRRLESRPGGLGYQRQPLFEIALPAGSPAGEASIREHAVAWHPTRQKFYLLADVVPLAHAHHPNTYDTQLWLWSSPDLVSWTLHGVAVKCGVPGASYDGHGVASPAGMVFHAGKLYAPFSARRTPGFTQRSIGLAYSGDDPERLPWTKTTAPVSDLEGEDDDPALVAIEGDPRLHLYHRTTAGGYRIVHTASATPDRPQSWPIARTVLERPADVRAQELTGAMCVEGRLHLLVIEHGRSLEIGHYVSRDPQGPFAYADPAERFLTGQPATLAYGGHITPIVCQGRLVALSWTVVQAGKRYGIQGHRAQLEGHASADQ